MGTRSHTVIKQGEGVYAVMYRQYDGYPSAHGQELADFMEPFKFLNGFGGEDKDPTISVANGAGCFAAQMVMHFKSNVANRTNYDPETKKFTEVVGNTIGGIYLSPLSEQDERHAYTYEVNFPATGAPVVTVYEGEDLIATDLDIAAFKSFCETYEA